MQSPGRKASLSPCTSCSVPGTVCVARVQIAKSGRPLVFQRHPRAGRCPRGGPAARFFPCSRTTGSAPFPDRYPTRRRLFLLWDAPNRKFSIRPGKYSTTSLIRTHIVPANIRIAVEVIIFLHFRFFYWIFVTNSG